MRRRTAGTTRTKVLVVLGVLGAAFVLTAISSAAQAPATPTITGSPPNPSASTRADFVFTGESGSTFACKLDAGAVAACTSPKSYVAPAFAPGSHTFRVNATKGGKTSGDAVYTWTVAAPATPTVGTSPANPTNATSATFTFTTNASNATFECALDAPFTFASCASPRGYGPGLAAGSHEFRVRALGPTGSSAGTSSAASYTWTIDTTPPPAPSIGSGPPSPTNVTSASFAFADSEGGVSFLCRLDTAAVAACVSPRSYSGLTQGSHTFQVQARDAAGNESGATGRTWTIDVTPPPKPAFTQVPHDPSPSPTATFAWSDAEGGVTFQCLMDEPTPWVACSSPTTFTVNDQNTEQHQFSVRAVDAAGNLSGVATYSWKLDHKAFQITGSVAPLLYPGAAAVAIPLRIANPNSQAIYITSLTVTATNSPNGCAPSNLDIQPSPASSGNTFVVPANAVNYPVPTAFQPTIRLKNTSVNQNVCKSQTFSLSYSGSAHS